MRYRLINANNITFNSDGFITAKNIEKMPCIYADLPNGMDGEHYVLEQEPKKGKWILSDGYWRCSNCKEKALLKFDNFGIRTPEYIHVESDYCPHCGAKMMESGETKQGLAYADQETMMSAT